VKAARLSIVLSLLIVVLTSLTGSQVQIEGKVSATRPEIANCIMLVKVVARQGSRVLASGHELLDTTGVYVLPINAGITPTQQRPVVKYGTHHRIKRTIHNGDTTYVPLDHNIPSEMFSDLHPYWYCNKCKIQF